MKANKLINDLRLVAKNFSQDYDYTTPDGTKFSTMRNALQEIEDKAAEYLCSLSVEREDES